MKLDRHDERVLELAVGIVAGTSEVERISESYSSRDRYTSTIDIRSSPLAPAMSEEEALEQLMEWCIRRLQKIRKPTASTDSNP